MNKKIVTVILSMLVVFSLVACGKSTNEIKNETQSVVQNEAQNETQSVVQNEAQSETQNEVQNETVVENVSESIESEDKEILEEKPSGINEDGMGEDPNFGEGIGEVVALSDEEREYVQKQTTNSWLDMTEEAKDELVVLIGRWLEESSGYIVPDYDDLVAMLDHQMEQYYRNGVDESVYNTVCDILDVD
jgi:hypothetical protein